MNDETIIMEQNSEQLVIDECFSDSFANQKQWICNACGGDSDTGCLSSTGECYR